MITSSETEYFLEVKYRMLIQRTMIFIMYVPYTVNPDYLPHLSSVIILNHNLRLLDSIGRGKTVCPS